MWGFISLNLFISIFLLYFLSEKRKWRKNDISEQKQSSGNSIGIDSSRSIYVAMDK